jgi:polygalacturonase
MLIYNHAHRAEDFEGETGGERIQAAIAAAHAEPGHSVVVVGPVGPDRDGRWIVKSAIKLPSHTTLLLVGAYLFLADNANCALIQNSDYVEGNTDIHVVGVGGARLDGNPNHQARTVDGRDVEIWMEQQGMRLSRATTEAIGNMSVAEFEKKRATAGARRGYGIRFYNVEDLTIQGLTVGPTNFFAVRAERLKNVRISQITLAQDGSEPNQDGIHIVGPAERVVISDIIGTCGDDAIAIDTAMPLVGDQWYEDNLPRDVRRAGAGPITGVTINNVVIRNRWCTGILRTLAAPGYPIDGIYASNLQLLETPGYSEGHAVLKFGTARPGYEGGEQCAAAEHANITVENVLATDWRGPYCAVFSPTKNLTVRGARGTHTGPFLHNFGQAIDGLTLDDCRTTLKGGPEEPFVTGMISFGMENYHLEGTLLTGAPAAIILDGGPLKDVTIRDVFLASELKPGDRAAGTGVAGLRLGPGAEVHSLRVTGLTIDGFESGIVLAGGNRGEGFQVERVTMRDVGTPWVIENTNVVAGDVSLPFGVVKE